MTDKLQTLPPGASLAELQAELDRGLVAIIADASGFHGLITRVRHAQPLTEIPSMSQHDKDAAPRASPPG
jgi:hypothetical protein